jgi:cytochrome c biogenesis protein CcmG, thiol:disulfide interchange protein DsbE
VRSNGGKRSGTFLKVVLGVGLISAVAVGLVFGLRPRDTGGSGDGAPALVGASGPAPAFKLPRLLGQGRLSDVDLDGSPYVLNFWATWCDPCRKEMPAFEKVWQEYKSRDVTVVGVNINDDLDAARDFARKLGVTYPLVVDENDELATELGVKGLPQTFFVDAQGEIAGSGARLGVVSEGELTRTIDQVLEGRS